MTASSLLANLVAVRGLPPEPVATEALEHLLATNHVASKGLDEVCRELVPGLDHDLEWRGQVRAEDTARPDLVGFTNGTARVVLEAKFTADLTALQATPTYLDRLKAGRPGLLLFVVPENRLAVLWPRLLVAIGVQSDQLSPPRDRDAPWRHELGDGRAVAAIAWDRLLNRIEAALQAAGDHTGLGALQQLQGLVTDQSRQGLLPILDTDFPERTGHQLAELVRILTDVGKDLTGEHRKVSAGSGDGFDGRSVTSPAGARAWFGIWLAHWSRYGLSPVWVQGQLTGVVPWTRQREALQPLATRLGVPVHPDPRRRNASLPIALPIGAEAATVRQHIRDIVTETLVRLDDLLPERSLPTNPSAPVQT